MKKLEIKDFETICNEFHKNFVSDQLQPARIVDALTKTYQSLFGVPSDDVLGWENMIKCGIFVCEFKYFQQGAPPPRDLSPAEWHGVVINDLSPVEWYGVMFRCINKSRSLRPFTKSLPEFLHFYDNPTGYFRLEQIYMNDQ